MKKNTKKILSIVLMLIFIVSTASVAFLGGGRVGTQGNNNGTTITNTPADNYKDVQRPQFCGTGEAKNSTYITEFQIPTACTQPLAITTDTSGHVWFTESNTGNLGKFDPSSKTFQEFVNPQWQSKEKSMMWGLATEPNGNIWFTDSQHNLIWKFNPTDKSYNRFAFPMNSAPEGSFPQMLIIDDKKAFVNDFTGKKIGVFSTNQTGPSLEISSIPSPGNYNFTSTMVTDPSGKLWYTVWVYQQGGNLVSYDQKTGSFKQYPLPTEIQAPNGISIDSKGKLWVMDTASSFFFVFDPSSGQFTKFITSPPPPASYGNATGLIKTPISRPYWNQFDDQGRLWFNEQVANSLGVFDESKQSLVEYLVPSKNPAWSDCGDLQDCGVSQVLDFSVNHNKVWFTEWVENNIGVLDSSVGLPMDVNTSDSVVTLHRGQNSTISFTINPQEHLDSPVSIITSNTAGLNNISIDLTDILVTVDKPKVIKMNISEDNFALLGTYKILIGVRYHDVTISKFVTVTLD